MKNIVPFSNGTEAMVWLDNNCDVCRTRTGCGMKYRIEKGFITGEISLKTAEAIGYENNRLARTCQMKDKREIKTYRRKSSKKQDEFQLELI